MKTMTNLAQTKEDIFHRI